MKTPLRFPRGLYGITPEWSDTQRLIAAVRAAAAGGMVALQWRRKTATRREGEYQARALAAACKSLGVVFIINDDWRLALALDADGAHLGREDGALIEARQALGPDKILGCSCYNDPALAQQALAADVDYIAFGAMYPSSVKPDAVRATLDHIRAGRMLAERTRAGRMRGDRAAPRAAVVTIGGLTADNAAPVIRAGADSVALISGLFGASNIQATARRCRDLFETRG
ncbi:thiamine phosphate synthase [Paralcaligenes ureilyticus]|uniref:Thiamine-phosphate synthase n=1 Tax=Paralcaligenes ureilyticus TaxID=627131 RepID=A0A4R3M716_9BURK|nr:thiamine phosphate synthase [Paralcaligenes ureilyticus]TCT09110.1 thiamine-phosphate diphosphorylase [Paralcaligenes ureilyticus]